MKKTYKEIADFLNAAVQYLANYKDDSKFNYAISRAQRLNLGVFQKYQEALEDLRIKHCAVSAEGIILRDGNGGYQFTKEGLGLFNIDQRKLSSESVDIEQHIVPTPEKFDEQFRDIFTGFVI